MDGIRIETGDFRQLSPDLDDDSVDLVLTDPPYPKEFLPLWDDLGRVSARVLKPGGFLVAYSGAMFLPEIMTMLGEHLNYYWLGGLCHRGPKVRVWARYVLQAMKPILVYQKPPFRRQRRFFVNSIESPTQSKEFHRWGQSVLPVRRLLETFTEPGELVYDPMTGGGTTAVACLQTNRRFIGYEIDPDVTETARQRVGNCQLPLPLPAIEQLDFAI